MAEKPKKIVPVTPLYPTKIWSPVPLTEATQSATMPPKFSWDTADSSLASYVITSTGDRAQPATGLGVQFGDVEGAAKLEDQSPTKYRLQHQDLADPTTSSTKKSSNPEPSSTFPLVQRPFGTPRATADQPRLYAKNEVNDPEVLRTILESSGYNSEGTALVLRRDTNDSDESFVTNPFANQTPPESSNFFEIKHTEANTEIDRSAFLTYENMSVVSSPPHEAEPGNGKEAPFFTQGPHPQSFDRQKMDGSVSMNEGYPHAGVALKVLNPEIYRMKWSDRVVCMKTDFVENIQWSVQKSEWVTMDKVGERVMRLWLERDDTGGKVLLLFSVNGQKSYCGMAEMMGAWTKGGNHEGWKDKNDGTRSFGVIPLRWIYVKNVSYDRFLEIRHAHNGQCIVNMWNGMHFPYDAGRKVVEIYVRSAHFTNVLQWRKDGPYNPRKTVAHAGWLDPRLWPKGPNTAHNGRQGTRGGYKGQGGRPVGGPAGQQSNKLALSNWRPLPQQRAENSSMPPTGLSRGITNRTHGPLPPALDGTASPMSQPVQMITTAYIINEQGTPVPVYAPQQARQATSSVGPGPKTQAVPPAQLGGVYKTQHHLRSHPSFSDLRGQLRGGSRGGYHGGHGNMDAAVSGGPGGPQSPTSGSQTFCGSHSQAAQQALRSNAPSALYRMQSTNALHNLYSDAGRKHDIQGGANVASHLQHAASTPKLNDPTPMYKAAASSVNFVPRGNTTNVTSSKPGASGKPAAGTTTNSGNRAPVGLSKINTGVAQHAGDVQTPTPRQTHFVSPVTHAARDSVHEGALAKLTFGFMTPAGNHVYQTTSDTQALAKTGNITSVEEALSQREQRLLKQKQELEKQLQIISWEKAKSLFAEDNSSQAGNSCDGDSVFDKPDWASSSSVAKRNVSPFRSSEGHAVDSISQQASPQSKIDVRAATQRGRYGHFGGAPGSHTRSTFSDGSIDARIKANVDALVDSPGGSVAADNKHSATTTHGSENEAHGGIRLS